MLTTTAGTTPADVRATSRAADLPRAGWDALAGPSDIFLTCRWLDVVEATAGVPMTYLWTERDGRPVAGLATALAGDTVPWALGRPDVVLRNSVTAGLPGAAELLAGLGDDPTGRLMPTLLAGGRQVGGTRLLTGPEATAADVTSLVAAAEALARDSGAATVCFLYLDEREESLVRLLAERGYRAFTSGHYSSLRVPPDGYPGYLAALPRKRRVSIGAERRRIVQAGVTVAAESLDAADLDRFAELESQLLAKYEIDLRPGQLLPLLHQVRDCFGDDAFAMVARAEGEVRGFALILRHGDSWYARQTGYDYAYQQRSGAPLYFELLYYRLIEEAAMSGVRTVHYGLGSVDTKRSRGCTATEQRGHLLFL
ncbi:GNAT family N-acetyltransferase [Actinoplanes oblitus]|uniref:GNAT family N-acetyltransferase n=1 Tax=Actinoplanes oblitus TaxID=3040509 RepID=A0ABY8WQV5_9ACTN|nr:GNAT family N-acetyltransferase [Actinoplanes oblitus]WIM99827.1 GNAT family N-acetyltransferase [Actinoplanes oblitus]